MTIVTQSVRDVTGIADATPWYFSSTVLREADDDSVVTTREIRATPVDGVLTVELEPGPAVVKFNDAVYAVTVPDTDCDLWSLIGTAVIVPPATPAELVAAAVADYMSTHMQTIDGGTP